MEEINNDKDKIILTKKQIKKLKKHEKWLEKKKIKKEQKKEMKKLKKLEKLENNLDEIKSEHKYDGVKTPKKKDLIRNQLSNSPIVLIDQGFDYLHKTKDLNSLISQYGHCNSLLKKFENPINLVVLDYSEESKKILEHRNSFKMLLDFQNTNILDYINSNNKDIEDLVYLTGDAEEEINNFEENKIYILGGIVDRNKWKNITLDKAKELNIKTKKLPISKYMKLKTSSILTVNQCFEILMRLNNKESFKDALNNSIPSRKVLEFYN